MSDDMEFLVKGFDVQIRNDMARYFPDTDGVLHYPDNTPNSQRVMTMSIIGMKYFQRTNTIYNNAYESWYADDEETQKAKLLNKYCYIHKSLFRHKHYLFGAAEKDALYKRNDDILITEKDKNTFLINKSNNFGI